MRFLIRENRIIGTVTDRYEQESGDILVAGPDDFDVQDLHLCTYADGVVTIPSAKDKHNKALLEQIVPLQQKALRALVEDAPDTTFLEQHKAKIAALRAQWQN